jgi:hypothetical protein
MTSATLIVSVGDKVPRTSSTSLCQLEMWWFRQRCSKLSTFEALVWFEASFLKRSEKRAGSRVGAFGSSDPPVDLDMDFVMLSMTLAEDIWGKFVYMNASALSELCPIKAHASLLGIYR